MKKLILIFALLITALSYGQITKFQVAGYKSLSTTQRDALTVTGGERWKIYNNTTLQWEYWNGTSWVALVGVSIETDPIWMAEEPNVARLDGTQTFTGNNNFSGGTLSYTDPETGIGGNWVGNHVANKQYLFDFYQPLGEFITLGVDVPDKSIIYEDAPNVWLLASATTKQASAGRLRYVPIGGLSGTQADSYDFREDDRTGTDNVVLYLSATAGQVTETPPTGTNFVRVIGNMLTNNIAIYELRSTTTVKGDGTEVNGVTLAGKSLNSQFYINATYTTLLADENKKGIVLGGDIILDATLLPAEYDIHFINNSGAPINITIAAGQNVLNGQTIPDVLEQGYYMYAEVMNSTVWSIIVGKEGGGGISGSIADTQVAFGNASGDIIGSNNLTFDGDNAELTGQLFINTPTSGSEVLYVEGIGGTSNLVRFNHNTASPTIGNTPSNLVLSNSSQTNDSWAKFSFTAQPKGSTVMTALIGAQFRNALSSTGATDIVFQSRNNTSTWNEVLRLNADFSSVFLGTVAVGQDPTLDTHVGNRGYNDGRYGQLAVSNTWLVDQEANNFISQNNFILKPLATGNNDFVINKSGNDIQMNSASGELLINTVNTNVARFGGALYTTTLFTDLPITTMTIAEIDASGVKTLVPKEWVESKFITDIVVQGFNNPISTSTVGTSTGLSYQRAVPIIIGDTPRTIADNYTGVLFTNDQATPLTITIPDTFSDISGWQFSAAKFGIGDVILDPTGTTTINGSTATITITTQYTGVVQLFYMGNADWHLIGKL